MNWIVYSTGPLDFGCRSPAWKQSKESEITEGVHGLSIYKFNFYDYSPSLENQHESILLFEVVLINFSLHGIYSRLAKLLSESHQYFLFHQKITLTK